MKTSIVIYKKIPGQDCPVQYALIVDNGNPYDLESVLNAMGLPTLSEIAMREYLDIKFAKIFHCPTPYIPSWSNMAEACDRIYTSFIRMTEDTGDLLPIKIAEVECTPSVADGGDALAMYAETMSHNARDKDEDLYMKTPIEVHAIIRGFDQDEDQGLVVPCVYVLYKGDKNELLRKISDMSRILHNILTSEEIDSYTIAVVKSDE